MKDQARVPVSDGSKDFVPDLSNYKPPIYTKDPIYRMLPPYFIYNRAPQAELAAHKADYIDTQRRELMENKTKEWVSLPQDDSKDFEPDLSKYQPPIYTSDPAWRLLPPLFAWNGPTQAELDAHKSVYIEAQRDEFLRKKQEETKQKAEQKAEQEAKQKAVREAERKITNEKANSLMLKKDSSEQLGKTLSLPSEKLSSSSTESGIFYYLNRMTEPCLRRCRNHNLGSIVRTLGDVLSDVNSMAEEDANKRSKRK